MIAQKILNVFFFMVKSRKKRIKERREQKAFSFALALSFLILAGILVFSNIKIKRETEDLLARKAELEEELRKVEEEKEKLEKGLSESEESLYWEGKIREQGYKKPGENVVVVKKPEGGDKNVVVKAEAAVESFWQKLLAQVRSVF